MRTSSGRVAAIGVAAASLALAACDITIGASEYSVREEKTFSVAGQTQLALSTFDGSIEVRGWDRNEVVVEVEKIGPDQKTVERIQVQVSQQGNAITVDVPKPSSLGNSGFDGRLVRRSPSANLVVSVPQQTTVTARSGDGSITVRRVNGRLDLDTGDGSIRVEEVEGTLVAKSGDGSVSGRKVDGQVDIHTGDGSVGLEGVLSGVSIETLDGSVDVTARPGSRAAGAWDVTTGDGDINLEVPEGFGADVDARTGDGHVRIDSLTDTAGAGTDRDGERRSVTGRLGGGGKPLRLRTSSGSITVKRW